MPEIELKINNDVIGEGAIYSYQGSVYQGVLIFTNQGDEVVALQCNLNQVAACPLQIADPETSSFIVKVVDDNYILMFKDETVRFAPNSQLFAYLVNSTEGCVPIPGNCPESAIFYATVDDRAEIDGTFTMQYCAEIKYVDRPPPTAIFVGVGTKRTEDAARSFPPLFPL